MSAPGYGEEEDWLTSFDLKKKLTRFKIDRLEERGQHSVNCSIQVFSFCVSEISLALTRLSEANMLLNILAGR